VAPKDYRTPYERAYQKAYIQFKLDLATADDVFNKAVAPFRKEYEKAKQPLRKAFDEAAKPLVIVRDDTYKKAKSDYKKAKTKAQYYKGGPKYKKS